MNYSIKVIYMNRTDARILGEGLAERQRGVSGLKNKTNAHTWLVCVVVWCLCRWMRSTTMSHWGSISTSSWWGWSCWDTPRWVNNVASAMCTSLSRNSIVQHIHTNQAPRGPKGTGTLVRLDSVLLIFFFLRMNSLYILMHAVYAGLKLALRSKKTWISLLSKSLNQVVCWTMWLSQSHPKQPSAPTTLGTVEPDEALSNAVSVICVAHGASEWDLIDPCCFRLR